MVTKDGTPGPETWSALQAFLCFLNQHEWRVLMRYSWALRTRLLVCERCSRCGARRSLPIARDYSLIR